MLSTRKILAAIVAFATPFLFLPSAHALWPDPCVRSGDPQGSDHLGWTAARVADGVSVRMNATQPANLGWPGGFCQGDNSSVNFSVSWAMVEGPRAADGQNEYIQVGVWNSINASRPVVYTEWSMDGGAHFYRNIYDGVSNPLIAVPTDGRLWTYSISPDPNTGYFWFHVVADNGGTFNAGSFVRYSDFQFTDVVINSETYYYTTGFEGRANRDQYGIPQGPLKQYDRWQYHTPAYGGVWTGTSGNPQADLAAGNMRRDHPIAGHGNYVIGESSYTRCALSPDGCLYQTAEG